MPEYDPENIGKQLPLEVFEECLDLHGKFIQHVNNPSQEDWEAIIEDLKYFIRSTGNMFTDYTVAEFKDLLNHKIKLGIETVGKHGDLLLHLKEIESKKKLEEPVVGKEETKRCPDCDLPKSLDEFNHYGEGKISARCIPCLEKKAIGRVELEEVAKGEPIEPEETELEKMRRNNAELSQKLSHYENQEEMMTEQEWLAKQVGGKGHYFMSAILKDPTTGELHNFIDQVYGESEQHAVGVFVLSKEVINQIIISISYEKSILDQDVQHS